ncbi:MAG: ABC transporter permease [Candidatus Heimdallarchaeota archaeon]|nr:ABC transporter permease [Candidatus Heimdallarchaeota archaeon]
MSEHIIASAIVISSTFFLIPTIGEIFAEKSGVLNLGIEGMIVAGAAGSFLTTYLLRGLAGPKFLGGDITVWIGLLAGMLIGTVLALLHSFVSVTLNRNQIVSGIALTIFGTGLGGLFGRGVVGKQIETSKLDDISIPILKEIPFFGAVLFNRDIIVYFSYILVPLAWFILFRTKLGLMIRTVGENPISAHNQGINVKKIRHMSVLFGGALAGLSGAYLSLAWLGRWQEGITNDRGWIVIALVIVALWHPINALIGSYIFGVFWVYKLQFANGVDVLGFTIKADSNLMDMLPYLSTLGFLIIGSVMINFSKVKRLIGAPTELTVPFYDD